MRKLPPDMAKRIRKKILQVAEDEKSLGNNVTWLKTKENAKRLRVGDWRVVYELDQDLVILDVARRPEIY